MLRHEQGTRMDGSMHINKMSQKCVKCVNVETDPSRGDTICLDCGLVLEESVMVSQTTFDESSSGKVMPLGHFVANDSTGGATNFSSPYYANGRESRSITIQNARKGITHLCVKLNLSQNCIDAALNFYKLALNKHLTRGRKQAHNQAACVYITCRMNRTEHMLIDISDILQICVHELGRTYLRFTQSLMLTLPSIDPCLYIMRFAHKLEFGDKAQAVCTTALRVVQRMKRDSIHSGRRPSGLCGAALLIAARLHEFNRSPADIVKIVKVHESTLRKRLMEFGDTPSSALTLDEFMTVDLEEEQDPPAFKMARKKDKERLQKLENIDMELSELQAEIDKQLEDCKIKKPKRRRDNSSIENEDAERFIRESNLSIIQQYVENNIDDPDDPDLIPSAIDENNTSLITGLGPDIASMMPTSDHINELKERENSEDACEEISINDIDDDELDSYILSEKEVQSKSALWNKVNATYLVQQKEKEEKRLKEKEEGKPEKKRRRISKKNRQPATTAGEAIEKMLQEKKISSKINYEVLKSLNAQQQNNKELSTTITTESDDVIVLNKPITVSSTLNSLEVSSTRKYRSVKPNTQQSKKLQIISKKKEEEVIDEIIPVETDENEIIPVEMDEPIEDTSEIVYNMDEEELDTGEMSLGKILESHHQFSDDGEYD